jgi:flagellar biogenesis protein FliO
MDMGLAFRGLYALAVIGVLLFVLWYAAKLTGRNRIVTSASKRLITVLDTTFLSQQSTMHVVKVGSRYLLVGSGANGLALISELQEPEVEAWLEEQRRMHAAQTASLGEILKRLRGR